MNIRSFALLILAISVFSGCNTNTSLQAGRPLATLMLTPRIVESSYLTQAMVPLYSKASINHLIVKLFKAEAEVATKDVLNAALDNAVTINNLAFNNTYQVRCYAYKAAGTAPSDLISTADSNSYTDVTIANDDRPVLANIKVKLFDSSFAAQGTASVAVTSGGFFTIATTSFVPVIAKVAGNGTAAYSGDGGAATSAALKRPAGIAFDSLGNLYIADENNHRIRKVTTATGIITTVAGNGTAAYSGDGGAATNAALNYPCGVTCDSAGNLYISDLYNHRIRKVTTATGIISTIAGTGTAAYSGDGGAATSAALNNPLGMTFDSAGNFYIADECNHRIRKITAATGIISTIAGTGTATYSGDGGAATSAALNTPAYLTFDSAGNLYISDYSNNRIRKITTATGIITTVVGKGTAAYSGDGGAATNAELCAPIGVALDGADNLYISELGNQRIRKVTTATGIISTFAGTGTTSYSGDGGLATSAALSSPFGIACDSAGNLYIADYNNHRIRIVF